MKFFAAISAFVAVAAAQDLSSLPPCGQTCINNMVGIASSQFGCAVGDIACYCREPRFALGLNDCSQQACGSDVNRQVTAYGQAYCANAGSGAAGAASGAASGVASSASSAASGVSASASSAIASISSGLASASASIVSAASSAASAAGSAASSATSAAGSAASGAASSAKSAAWAAPTQAPVIGAGIAGLAAMLLV